MSRRRTPARVSQHDNKANNALVSKALIALAVLWGLFMLWRLVLAKPAEQADVHTQQLQQGKLRTKVRSSVQKVLIDNYPGMQLYHVDRLLVFTADGKEGGEAPFAQAALSHYQQMSSEQQATTLFVCLPPLLQQPQQSRPSRFDFAAVRKQLLTSGGVHEWQVVGDGRLRGVLEATMYLRQVTEAVREMYAPKSLAVHLFDDAGSVRSGFGKAANWVLGLMPSLEKHVVLQHHLVPVPPSPASSAPGVGGGGNSVDNAKAGNLSEQVASLLHRARFVSSAKELQGYMLLGAHQQQ